MGNSRSLPVKKNIEPDLRVITTTTTTTTKEEPSINVDEQALKGNGADPVEGGKSNDCDDRIVELELNLRKTKGTTDEGAEKKHRKLTLPCPRTYSELKRNIEDQYQIPTCMQELYFNSRSAGLLLRETPGNLSTLYLRDGDVITVEYRSDARVNEINQVMKTMREAVDFLETNATQLLDKNWTLELQNQIKAVLKPKDVEGLMRMYFLPHTSELSDANRLHFVHNNGIQISVRLYKTLSSYSWDCMSFEMQCMERAVLIVIWNLSASLGIRCLLLQQPSLIDCICRSIVRQKIPTDQVVLAPAKQRAIRDMSVSHLTPNNLLIETMFKGMGVVTKYVSPDGNF